MPDKPQGFYSAGKYRTINFPSLGAYDLVTGQGYTSGNYAKSPAAYACMDIRATALAEIPWRLTPKDSGGTTPEQPITNHPILELLQRGWVNGMNLAEAIKSTEIDLCRAGAAFWLKDRDSLARLNPDTIEVLRNRAGVTGFKQRVYQGGQAYENTYSIDEVVYFREYHPNDDLGKGTPKLELAKNAILAEFEAQRYIKAFFENDAIPGMLIHTEQDVPPTEMTKLAKWWETKFGSARDHHKVAFVDKGLEAQVLSTDLRAMALAEVRDEARRDICAIFGLDPILLGGAGKGSFSNTHEARMSFMQEVIIPRGDYYSDVINAQLVAYLDDTVQLEMATEELPILQEDKDKKAARLKIMLDANVITVEFFRKEMGIPEDAGPSTQELQAQKQAQLDAMAQGTPQKPADLARWQKKAVKALRAGKSADVSFVSSDVPETLQKAIRSRLEHAGTVADIELAFTRPYP